jgi:DNA ligase (NAD+)
LKEEDLLQLPRFAEKSARNLIEAIGKSKHATLARFLFAIGILHVGEYASKLLARNFRKLEDLYHVKKETVLAIKQVGEKIAASVSAFFNDRKNLALLDAMKRLGLELSNPDFAAGGKESLPLTGLTFVITGTLPSPRSAVEALIETHGGHAASAVSASTDYLVAGEDAGSKLTKAKNLGVKIIAYDTLIKMIEKNMKQPGLF